MSPCMSQPARSIDGTPAGTNHVLWALIVLYAVARVLQLFAGRIPMLAIRLPASYWRLAVLFYGISAVGNILLVIPVAGPSLVTDASGAQWKLSDITGVCALVSIFIMGGFAVRAWGRLICD